MKTAIGRTLGLHLNLLVFFSVRSQGADRLKPRLLQPRLHSLLLALVLILFSSRTFVFLGLLSHVKENLVDELHLGDNFACEAST